MLRVPSETTTVGRAGRGGAGSTWASRTGAGRATCRGFGAATGATGSAAARRTGAGSGAAAGMPDRTGETSGAGAGRWLSVKASARQAVAAKAALAGAMIRARSPQPGSSRRGAASKPGKAPSPTIAAARSRA